MKKKKQSNGWLKGLLPVGLMALFVSMAFVPRLNAATYMVSVDPGTTYQTLDGFGAATAWYTNWVTTHPNKAELYKILFNELGLDIIRFRNTYGSRNGASFAPDEPEIVQQANLSLGHPIKVLISSWTPPSDLKANGTLNGGTLVKENGAFPYSKFADYWYNSLVAYANKGISPDYISIQNEPDYENTGWETCIFKPVEDANYPGYNKALDAVYQRVQSLTNRPKLLGPEACGLDSTLGTYTDNMDLSKVYGICHHLYNGGNGDSPDSFISNMKSYGSRYKGKPIFQTEYDYGTPFTTGNLIINALVEEGASSYFFWDLIWAPGQRPLVEVENPSGQSSWTSSKGYTISDFYYVFKQFAKFTDPGFKRVAATANSSDIRTTAFVSPDQNQLSIILINNGSTQSTVSLNLNGYSAANATVYRTIPGGSEKCANVGTLGAENTVTLPAQSIATVVITKGSTVTPSPTSTIIVPTLPPTTTATSTPSPTPTSVLGCAVSYTMYDWGSGATVSITIKNNGATAINGWTLAWDFPGNQKITNLWNGSYTQNGTAVAVKNLSYNGTIPAKGSVNFGFNIAYSGSNAKPTGFTLNGTACSVQ